MTVATDRAVGPLDGVRILDLTRLLPGGVLGAILGDLGAEVIKVEEPTLGDYMRWEPKRIGAESAASWIVGRNKRSIAVNLKDPAGVELVLTMAEQADVVVEGFRPGVSDRLGIGYEGVSARNPRIVYASLTGYGSDGPMRDAAGHDINYISYAGVLGMTGPPQGPVCPPGVQVGDLGGATILGIGILAALYSAARSGRGCQVEVSMYDAALAWTSIHAGELWASGQVPDPGHMLLNGAFPCYNVYACSDGRYVSVGAVEPKFWAAFCASIERPDLVERITDPTARATVAEVFATKTRDEWVARLAPADVCVAPVLDLAEALAYPLATERGMVQRGLLRRGGTETGPTLGTPIRVNGRIRPVGTPPPALGEDTVALALEAGLSQDQVDALLASGALKQAARRARAT